MKQEFKIKTMKDKLIAKQKELIELALKAFEYQANDKYVEWWKECRQLESEIVQLEKELSDQKPEFDKDYLDECIEKATPNLLKIKDVDKELAEIRGQKRDEELKQQLKQFAKYFNETVEDSCDFISTEKIDNYLKSIKWQ